MMTFSFLNDENSGPRSVLTSEQEQRFVDFLLYSARIGYGLSHKDIPQTVKSELDRIENLAIENGEPPPAKKFNDDNLPSLGWVYRFLRRHPELSKRMPESLGYQKTYVTEQKIRDWFAGVEKFLQDQHKIDAASFFCEANAQRVFNLDESGFPLAGTNGKLKIITARGAKNVYKVGPDSKEQVTVLGCCSADGHLEKPFVIFPGKRPNYNFEGVDPRDFVVGHSPNGWISADSFFGWMANIFYPSVKDRVQFPIIVFMDGHISHLNLAVAKFCRMHDIILLCFPPHASHVMQPLDISVYGPLKKFWNESLDKFKKTYKGLSMTRAHFFPVFDEAWKKAVNAPGNIKSGFRKAGIVPFSSDAIAYDRLEVSKTPDSLLKNAKFRSSKDEKIGIMRAMRTVKKNLGAENLKLFEERFENGYDVENDTDLNSLWRIYRDTRKLVENLGGENVQSSLDESSRLNSPVGNASTSGEVSFNTPETGHNQDTPDHSRTSGFPNNLTNTHDSAIPGSSTSTGQNLNDISFDNALPGPSTIPETPCFDRVEIVLSPWKDHLKISKNVIINRKVQTKSKVPFAVTGDSYINAEEKRNAEKKKKLEEKEERKRIKEAKKRDKEKGKAVKRRLYCEERSEESSENEIVFDDSDEAEFDDEENICFACDGSDLLHDANAWIGCSNARCKKWFHKHCLSQEVMEMTDEELERFEFFCNNCERSNRKQTCCN